MRVSPLRDDPETLLGRTNSPFPQKQQQRVAPLLSLKQPTGYHLSHTPPRADLLHIFPSKQHGLASSIILTLSVLPLTAQDVLSSQVAGNVKGIMAIYDMFMYSTAGRCSGGP